MKNTELNVGKIIVGKQHHDAGQSRWTPSGLKAHAELSPH